jgi:hypothetical protein
MALTRRTLLSLPVAVPFLSLGFASTASRDGRDDKGRAAADRELYFPPSDAAGGWRTLETSAEIRMRTGIDKARLDEAFQYT